MLASSHTAIAPTVEEAMIKLDPDLWAFEIKLDGIRCLMRVLNGRVSLSTRAAKDVTATFPDVVAASSGLPSGVYDGEIISVDGKFSTLARRSHSSKAESIRSAAAAFPATFIAFDLPDLTQHNYAGRRGRLLANHGLITVRSYDNAIDAWTAVVQGGLEGLIAKRADSMYRHIRSPDWIKLKHLKRLSAIVVGFKEGKGSRDGKVGALELALIDDSTIVSIGRVGTGFTSDELDVLAERINLGEPFAVEIEYANVTDDLKLRFPSYVGIRDDIEVLSCTVDQIDT